MNKILCSPCDGELIEIKKVKDPVFAQKMLGDGVAIIPSGNVFVAPCNGQIKVLFDTKHAIGISNEDYEILIHIGINTVELNGKGFKSYVKKGETVSKGDALIEVDLDFIKKEKYPTTTPIIFVDNPNIKFEILKKGKVKQGDKILEIT